MWKAFLKFYFHRNIENWRALRRACRDALPKADRKTVADSGE